MYLVDFILLDKENLVGPLTKTFSQHKHNHYLKGYDIRYISD